MQELRTAAGEEAPAGIPWNVYPRPQMVRKDWLCLNGKWDFEYGEIRTEIEVPFCPESLLSGLHLKMQYGRKMTYTRRFTLPGEWRGRRILLHFGAVSRVAEVRVNGIEAARHGESYLHFSADITDLVRDGENEITVAAVKAAVSGTVSLSLMTRALRPTARAWVISRTQAPKNTEETTSSALSSSWHQ